VVKLPWKSEARDITPNYGVAKGRLNHALKLLKTKNLIPKYQEIINDQVKRGFIEQIYESHLPARCHYIPHFPVIRDQHATTPIRIVMDASAKCKSTGKSLNDMLHTGPSLVPELNAVLLRFRFFQHTCISDISKAFLQVGIREEDRDYTRFLWLQDPEDPSNGKVNTYRFKRVLFGATSSPFLLQATIRYHFENYQPQFGVDTPSLIRNLYVDNLHGGASSEPDLLAFYKESIRGYNAAGLPLLEWISNNENLNSQAKLDQVVTKDSTNTVKMLGLQWNWNTDQLYLNRFIIERNLNTKRKILAETCKIFDPLGFFYPVTIRARMLVQELWKNRSDWDEEVSAEVVGKWNDFVTDAEVLFDLTLPRWIFTPANKTSLHVFTDASTQAMGCVAYVVADNSSRLLMSKARVAPVKELSVPKLELTAAVLGGRLTKYVIESFSDEITFSEIHMWSDSQIVLCWLGNDYDHKNVYVRNRVIEFRDLVPNIRLHHVRTEENPADLLTRGKVKNLKKQEIWWTGPSLLTNTETWPEYCPTKSKNATVLYVAEQLPVINEGLPNINRYSDLEKLLRITAYVLRVFNKSRGLEKYSTIGVRVAEMESAEICWLLEHQQLCFPKELELLKNEGGNKTSLSSQFKLKLDEHGLIRVHSRLQNADLPRDVVSPVLLSGEHKLSDLLIWRSHLNTCHGSVRTVMNYMRKRFWLLRCRQTIKKVLKNCAECKLLKGIPYHTPETPALPSLRVEKAEPFQFTGVDYMGPLYIRGNDSKKVKKCYIALFTCMVSRAVHLEVAIDGTSDAFARAFRRFVAYQTIPQVVYSDRGSNFVGFQPMLNELMEDSQMDQEMRRNRIEWRFIPAKAPWFGGIWERLVGITKDVLKRKLGRSFLTFEELQTVVAEVGSRVNSRPLTYVGTNLDEPAPLTPVQLMRGHIPDSLPVRINKIDITDESFEISKSGLTRRHKYIMSLIKSAWDNWQDEYLLALRERDRRNTPGKGKGEIIPALGDVVLYQDDVGQKTLKLGRIIKLIKSKDGECRVVLIKTPHGETVRPIRKVSYLESCEEKLTLSYEQPTSGKIPNVNVRPKRTAGLRALEKIKSIASQEIEEE